MHVVRKAGRGRWVKRLAMRGPVGFELASNLTQMNLLSPIHVLMISFIGERGGTRSGNVQQKHWFVTRFALREDEAKE